MLANNKKIGTFLYDLLCLNYLKILFSIFGVFNTGMFFRWSSRPCRACNSECCTDHGRGCLDKVEIIYIFSILNKYLE